MQDVTTPTVDADRLFHDNRRLAYYFARRLFGQFAAACYAHGYELEDVEQVCLLAFWKVCQSFDPDRGALATITGIACRHRLAAALRLQAGQPPVTYNSDSPLWDSLAGPDAADVGERLDAGQQFAAAREHLARLSPDVRAAVVAYAEGGNLAELARAAGVTRMAIRGRARAGLMHLRRALNS